MDAQVWSVGSERWVDILTATSGWTTLGKCNFSEPLAACQMCVLYLVRNCYGKSVLFHIRKYWYSHLLLPPIVTLAMSTSQWPRTSQTKGVIVFSLVLYVFHAPQCWLRLPQNQSVVSNEQKVLLVALRTQILMTELVWGVNGWDGIFAHLAREKKNSKHLQSQGLVGKREHWAC